jgi:predicted  nucleic acid-binding Zn-ribbon protein
MMGAKTNDVYRAFQHEIEFCEQEISRTEDKILDLMSEAESLDTNVKAAQVSLDAEKKQVAAEKKQAEERTAVDRKEIETLMAQRATVMAEISPAIAREYERIRKGRAGVAVAEAVAGRCSRCNIVLRPQFLQELKKNDQIMYCESCKRILYYNPPQGFDDLVPESVR